MNIHPWDYGDGLPHHHHVARREEPVVLPVRPARHRPRMMSGDYARAPMFYHMPGGLFIPEETHALQRSRSTGHRVPLEDRHYSPPQHSPNLPVVINNYQRQEEVPMRGRPISMAEDHWDRDYSPYAHHHSPRPHYREHSRPGAHASPPREPSPFHDWRHELETERLKRELEDLKREKDREAQEERIRKEFALEQARKEKERHDEETRLLLEQAKRKKERQEEETRILFEQAKKNKERQEEEERIVRERNRKQKEREEEQERLKRELMSAHEREKREREAEEERIKNEIMLKEEKKKRERKAEEERIKNEIMIEQAKKEAKKKEEEEQMKAIREQAILDWQRKEREKTEKEKQEQEKRDAEYKERLKRDFGLSETQVANIIKRDNDNAVDLRRVTFTKISKRHVSIETLKAYNLPYKEDDRDDGFVLIKRWVPEYEQELLWEHTRRIREERDIQRRMIELNRDVEERKLRVKIQKKKEVRAKSPGGFFGLVRR